MSGATLSEYVNQDQIKASLLTAMEAARKQGKPLGHALFYGPPGLGKTTIGEALAHDMGASFKPMNGATITKPGQMASLITSVKAGDVVFIDEALAIETPIPTPNGWTLMGYIKPGDVVYGADGNHATVTHVTDIAYDRPCYQVNFADGSSIVADAEHKWLAQPKCGSQYREARVVTTAMLAGDVPSVLYVTRPRHWRLPQTPVIERPHETLSIDPYVLGQWLGNGNTGQSYISVRPELLDATMATFQAAGEEPVDIGPTGGGLVRVSLAGENALHGPVACSFRQRLEEMEIFYAKAVPLAYKRGSIQQRLALVQGLMDTDGHISKDGTVVFSNTNEQIIDSLREILRTLGYACTKNRTTDTRIGVKGPHQPCWKVTFRPQAALNPFRLRDTEKVRNTRGRTGGRIVSVVPVDSVPVRCIAVDAKDHLFLAGEGMVPTHNCHRLPRSVEEILYSVMEQSVLDMIVGPTAMSQSLRLKVPPFTLIGATTRYGLLTAPLRARFGHVHRLEYYGVDALTEIIYRASDISIDRDAAEELAKCARGTPREAKRLLDRAKDQAIATGEHEIRVSTAAAALDKLGIDEAGLDRLDRLILDTIITRFALGPVGLETLASCLGEDPETIAEVREPYLTAQGYLARTARGRVALPKAILHLRGEQE